MAERNGSQKTFGPNAWLIDEMYREFREHPQSVAASWRDFFEDYQPLSVPAEVEVAVPFQEKAEARPEASRDHLPPGAQPITGGVARIVENMEKSLSVPTATSVRTVPVKLLEENRRGINLYLADAIGGKMSFTHLIAWAIIKALKAFPAMASSFIQANGTPHRVSPEHVNFGLAVDVERKDGSRTLLVPNIKKANEMDFHGFFVAYNEVLRKTLSNQLKPDDFMGTTVTLTNPGTIGTMHSVPRLMPGQGLIVATGAINYPPEYQAADPHVIAMLGISKVMTITSTYDHRIIQGAESGMFLRTLHELLVGEHEFYEEIFESMKIPYLPVRMTRDSNPLFATGDRSDDLIEKQARVLQLINLYRVRGHLLAHFNPLEPKVRTHSELEPSRFGLTIWDYDREFLTGGLAAKERLPFRNILDTLRDAYCKSIGIEYMHIQEPQEKEWIQQRVEAAPRKQWLTTGDKRRILTKLNAAEAFERFLHTKYVGHKRFSLEGNESLIPMLDALLLQALNLDAKEAVIGMAHRGRINVLVNVFGKTYEQIFRKFEDNLDPNSREGSGDVKYHLGAAGEYADEAGNTIKITLASNPSHLEAVDPVVEGMARARQDSLEDKLRRQVVPILIHGDAAFAGQGVVAETLNMSALPGYRTGGTVHLVVNNGIGFTTAPVDARSTVYPTDVAKMVQAPIFHVNGNDPEACVRVVRLAMQYRQAFQKDVVIDMIGYRRHGHNESDEPSYTQPIMYQRIKEMRSVRKLYTEYLVKQGDLDLKEVEAVLDDFQKRLETAFDETHKIEAKTVKPEVEDPRSTAGPEMPTGVARETLEQIAADLTTFPPNFKLHPKLRRLIDERSQMLTNDAIDWGMAEALAFGSLLLEGTNVRLAGQDSQRGTFSHRHAVYVDNETEEEYTPLQHLQAGHGHFMIHDSLLSEYAALGFEYGYSVIKPHDLTLWEAQFGDFANGAQIIIDQFISSAEEKWGTKSGLVLLLPHGFEGQGPEHSSARIERFLVLCAEENIRVAVPTTAAQYFHLLRDQVHRRACKPLIVLTPKSLLRAPAAKSATAEIVDGAFRPVLDDPDFEPDCRRLLFCSGKIAFDLIDYRHKQHIRDTAIIRLEQVYPFPRDQICELFKRHAGAEMRWVQEEPKNMGAWNFVKDRLDEELDDCKIRYIGRTSSASPATGSTRVHQAEQQDLVRRSFEDGSR